MSVNLFYMFLQLTNGIRPDFGVVKAGRILLLPPFGSKLFLYQLKFVLVSQCYNYSPLMGSLQKSLNALGISSIR
jgi:hypothetical protein